MTNKFKEGDKVIISDYDTSNWNSDGEMDITIGKVGTVATANRISCQVKFDKGLTRDVGWFYRIDCLTLAPTNTVPDELFRM